MHGAVKENTLTFHSLLPGLGMLCSASRGGLLLTSLGQIKAIIPDVPQSLVLLVPAISTSFGLTEARVHGWECKAWKTRQDFPSFAQDTSCFSCILRHNLC